MDASYPNDVIDALVSFPRPRVCNLGVLEQAVAEREACPHAHRALEFPIIVVMLPRLGVRGRRAGVRRWRLAKQASPKSSFCPYRVVKRPRFAES